MFDYKKVQGFKKINCLLSSRKKRGIKGYLISLNIETFQSKLNMAFMETNEKEDANRIQFTIDITLKKRTSISLYVSFIN